MDADSGLVHSVIGAAAHVSDVTQAQALLHDEESDVFGDAGYQGVCLRQGRASVSGYQAAIWLTENALPGTENTAQIITLFALSNLWIARRALLAVAQ